MEQSRGRSGRLLSRATCPAGNKQRPRAQAISHRRIGAGEWIWVAEYAGALASVRLEMARALRQLLRAPDYFAACAILACNPILLLESASELLRATAAEAGIRGAESDKEILLGYLSMLELARKSGVGAVIKKLSQKE